MSSRIKRKILKHFGIVEPNENAVRIDGDECVVKVDTGGKFADLQFLSELLKTKDINFEGHGRSYSEVTPDLHEYVTIVCRGCKALK